MKKTYLLLLFASAFVSLHAQRNAVYYEIFVRSFADSDGDGVGDINGITQKLDYLQQLGIGGLWLTPVHPSPTYHKYDVTDYMGIDPEYGSMNDYKRLVQEAHKRNIRILLDVVVNHTSSRHPWFTRACLHDPAYKDYYVWSDTITHHRNNWYPNPLDPQEKFYAFFWEGMPDLNFDNPKVREKIKKMGRYWLTDVGVDGFRLDAAQHVYDAEEVAKNNAWWTEFRKDMQAAKPDVFLVGEVWNKDSVVATYLRSSLDACFNFDLSGLITGSINKGNAEGFVSKLTAIDRVYRNYNPHYTDATFVSNHDQDRYCSTFNGDVAKTRAAFTILMTLPGMPFLYYGEELGMLGVSPDHYRREPFLWGEGSAGNTHWEKPQFSLPGTVSVLDVQMKNADSYYAFYKKMIALRKADMIYSEGVLAESPLAAAINNKAAVVYELRSGRQKRTLVHNIGASPVVLPRLKGRVTVINGVLNGNSLAPYSSIVIN